MKQQYLRTVPTIVTVHFEILGFPLGVAYRDIFVRFKQVILVSKKKIGGNHAFFRDNKASIWKKMPYSASYFAAF